MAHHEVAFICLQKNCFVPTVSAISPRSLPRVFRNLIKNVAIAHFHLFSHGNSTGFSDFKYRSHQQPFFTLKIHLVIIIFMGKHQLPGMPLTVLPQTTAGCGSSLFAHQQLLHLCPVENDGLSTFSVCPLLCQPTIVTHSSKLLIANVYYSTIQ